MPHVQPCSFFFFFKGVKPTKKDRKSNAQENSIPLPLWLPCCRALASRHRRPATTRAGMVFFGGAHLTTPAIQGGCWRCCFCCCCCCFCISRASAKPARANGERANATRQQRPLCHSLAPPGGAASSLFIFLSPGPFPRDPALPTNALGPGPRSRFQAPPQASKRPLPPFSFPVPLDCVASQATGVRPRASGVVLVQDVTNG